MGPRRNVVVLVRTVNDYAPAIVEEIRETYIQSCKYSSAIRCRFDSLKQQFLLEGDSLLMEYAFQDFMEIHQNIALAELRKLPLGGITRSRLTQLNAPAVPWIGDPDSKKKRKDDDDISVTSSLNAGRTPRGLLLEHEDYTMVEIWEPKVSKEEFNSMLRLNENPTIPEALSALVDCVVTCDWSRRTVKITTNDRDTLSGVLKKLRTIEEIFKRKFKPLVAHIVHVENKPRFQFKIVRLDKQPDRARTTLFEAGSRYYEIDLNKMSSVRLLEMSQASNGKFTNCRLTVNPVPTATKEARSQPREWADYLYLGQEASPHPTFTGTLAPVRSEELPELELEDIICEYHDATQGQASYVEGKYSQALPTTSGLDFPKRVPRIRAPVEEPPMYGATQKSMATGDPDIETQPMENYVPGFILDSRPSDVVDEEEQPQPALTTRKPKERNIRARIATPPVQALLRDARPTSKAMPATTPNHGITLGPKPSDDPLIDLDTPAMAAAYTTRQPKVRTKAKGKGKAAVSTWAPSLLDSDEQTSEVDSRQKENTMQQKARSKATNPREAGNDYEKLRQFNNHKINQILVKAFEQARSFQGEVTLEATLGRLLFFNMPREATRSTIEWDEWDNFVTHEAHFSTIFSTPITADHYDAEFIEDLEVNGILPLFSDAPSSKKVTYELEFKENGKPRLLVVDAESFAATLYDVSEPFATIYTAHPTHSWDSCLQISGRKTLLPSPAVESLVNSFAAPENAEMPEIRFSIFQSNDELQVDKFLVKRETRYPVEADRVTKGVPVEMVVTEVQSLFIKQKNRQMHFKAFAKERQEMKRDGRLWYTFSFVATEVAEMMLENLDVELGETVQWTTEEIMGGGDGRGFVITALNSVVNTVIRKIDDVGYGNCQVVLESSG